MKEKGGRATMPLAGSVVLQSPGQRTASLLSRMAMCPTYTVAHGHSCVGA